MKPIEVPPAMLEALQKGRLVALNVGSPPVVTARVNLGLPGPVDLGPVPSLTNVAFLAVAMSADAAFCDLVWIDRDELKEGKVGQ